MKILISLLLAGMLALSGCTTITQNETGFLDRTISVAGEEHRYQVYLPANYDPGMRWPVILFLHGAGERGQDGLAPTHVGLGRAIRFDWESWPAIVVFPQVPAGESWQGTSADVAIAALDKTLNEYSTDPNRQYLTGLSLGGNGTWYLGYHHTERFAALVAVCGFVDLDGRFPNFLGSSANSFAALAEDLVNKPVWIVHGDADVVVPVEQSRNMAEALKAVGAEVHYSELPGINHNSWDAAYSDGELISWLFEQRL